MTLHGDPRRIRDLVSVGLALRPFPSSLHPKRKLELEGKRWVYEPNVITLTPHRNRVKHFTLNLRGNPAEFAGQAEPPLRGGFAIYGECTVKSPRQVAAAATYIARARGLYSRGRRRQEKGWVVHEL